jgi:hypothetical protein
MITPLGKGRRKRQWFYAATIYTIGGGLGASAFGCLAGLVGRYVRTYIPLPLSSGLWCLAALLLSARDGGLIRLQLPQRTCQAQYQWFHRFDYASALAMWGFQIGVGFATFIQFSGFYFMTLVVVLRGGPVFGLLMTLAYWFGRALPVWLAPSLTEQWPMNVITRSGTSTTMFRVMSCAGLACCAVVSALICIRALGDIH